MANTASSQIWKVGDGRKLIWRHWDDEYVAFDPLSGDTHVLNPIAYQALRILEEQSVNCDQLSRAVAASLDLQLDDTLIRHMERLLAKFGDLGLIEPYRD